MMLQNLKKLAGPIFIQNTIAVNTELQQKMKTKTNKAYRGLQKSIKYQARARPLQYLFKS